MQIQLVYLWLLLSTSISPHVCAPAPMLSFPSPVMLIAFGRSQSPSPPCCNVTTRVTNRADTTLTSVSEQCGTRPKKGRSVQMAASGGETGANSDVETDHGESVDILRSGVERAIRVSGSFLQHLMRLGSPSLLPTSL